MRHTILFLSILLATGLAHAREGFHMGLGGGFSSLNGDDAVRVSGLQGGSPKTSQGGGGGMLLRLGYNIMGYGALEGLIQGQADSLGIDGEESWAANWRVGARLYPHWHWQSELPDYLQPLEMSFFLGGAALIKAMIRSALTRSLGVKVLVRLPSVQALSISFPMSSRCLSTTFIMRLAMTRLFTIEATIWSSMWMA